MNDEEKIELICRVHNKGGTVAQYDLKEIWTVDMKKDIRNFEVDKQWLAPPNPPPYGSGSSSQPTGSGSHQHGSDLFIITNYARIKVKNDKGVSIEEYSEKFKAHR
jgi:hypothetical protein